MDADEDPSVEKSLAWSHLLWEKLMSSAESELEGLEESGNIALFPVQAPPVLSDTKPAQAPVEQERPQELSNIGFFPVQAPQVLPSTVPAQTSASEDAVHIDAVPAQDPGLADIVYY
jgi:hypothetical protein